LGPNYSFGIAPYVPQVASSDANQEALVQEIRREFNDPMSAEKARELSQAEGLKEIGLVVSTNRKYNITFDGIESVNGFDTYHLSLRPTRTSNLLRLRELWVDTQTFATHQLVTQGNFSNNTVPWTVKFVDVDGTQYIESEDAAKPVKVGEHTYDRASIAFEGIAVAQETRSFWDPVTLTTNVLVEPH
jgi:hypothetical protein